MKIAQINVGLCVSLCAAILAGCASPAHPGAMIAQNIPPAGVQYGPVTVLVIGGHKTDPMWVSKISSEDFQTALIESLRKAHIFRSVEAGGDASYRLKVILDYLDQPTMGFNLTVKLGSDWTLAQLPGDRVLWHDRITSSYTATVGQKLFAVARLRVANEGAARKNIEKGLAELAKAKLDAQ